MEFTGLPLHALVVHGAVVLGPLAALLALGYVAVPPLREHFRWPLLVGALGAGLFVVLAYLSGRSHLDANPALAQLELVRTHRSRALWALVTTSVLTVITVGATTMTRAARGPLRVVTDVVLVLAALAALVAVVLTGDAGARAVWGS